MSDVKYHAAGFSRARGLATQGKVNRGDTWSPPPNPKPDDCLGVHSSAAVGAKGRPAYPVIKGDTLYRAGAIACKKRAAQQGETEIEGAAEKLLAIIDKDKAGASAVRTGKRIGALRGPTFYSDKTIEVDQEAGVIKNVSLMTVGPAIGWPFEIDQTTIEQLVALAKASPDGVKSRFKHPTLEQKEKPDGTIIQKVGDDTGTMVGRVQNVRIVGQQARGDIHLGSYAESLPGLGNVRKYLMDFANDDPTALGMSAFFSYDVEPQLDEFGNVSRCFARLFSLDAIDFVGTPAANPNGLLSARGATFDPQPPSGWQDPSPSDLPSAPIPVSTPEFPHDVRGAYLAAIVRHGPLTLGGLAARFSGRLEQMRATADWLVSHGYAEKVPSGTMQAYNATPSGKTRIATTNLWRDSK